MTGDARKNQADGKFVANWEGPYKVNHVLGKGAVKLEQLDGEQLDGEQIPNTWNANHL